MIGIRTKTDTEGWLQTAGLERHTLVAFLVTIFGLVLSSLPQCPGTFNVIGGDLDDETAYTDCLDIECCRFGAILVD